MWVLYPHILWVGGGGLVSESAGVPLSGVALTTDNDKREDSPTDPRASPSLIRTSFNSWMTHGPNRPRNNVVTSERHQVTPLETVIRGSLRVLDFGICSWASSASEMKFTIVALTVNK